MSRLSRPQRENENPSKRFLQWKSNDKCFEYYDKEAEKKVQVTLPLKLLFLEHYHTVKGWNDASESGIYSNEVYAINNEELNVKSFKGGDIASGLYKEIKQTVNHHGGVYYRSVYCMNEDGEIINLQIKGSAVREYSEFYKNNHHLVDNQWIEINDFKEQKKGSINYTTPIFTIGDVITRKIDNLAIDVAQTLQSYMDGYTSKPEEPIDDLEF